MKLTNILTEMAAKQVCPKCGHGPISKTHRYVQGKGWKCLNAPADPEGDAAREQIQAERKYYELLDQLQALEKQHRGADGQPLFLSDTNIDRENVLDGGDVEENTTAYWKNMYDAAGMAAGQRAEDEGLSINDLLGRAVY